MVDLRALLAKLSPSPRGVSRELLARVAEIGAIGMFLTDADGRIVFANRAFEKILGYDAGECVGLGVGDIVSPEDSANAQQQQRGLIADGAGGYQSERRYIHKTGRLVWVVASASLVLAPGAGKNAYAAVQITDIDRQKRADEELASAALRSDYALESSGQGLWDADNEKGTIFHSRNWKIMRGFSADDEIAISEEEWNKRIHPDDRERVIAINQAHRRGESDSLTLSYEYRERHNDGHWMWVLSRGRTLERAPDGTPARVIGTDTDISELKAVEAALAAEKERLAVTLHSIGDGVISTDDASRVTFINPVAEKMTGWTSAEAIGRPIGDVFAVANETTGQPAPNPVSECLAKQQIYYISEDVVLVGRTGDRKPVRDSAAPVRAPDGKIVGAVLVFQDITHSRALQKALAHSAMHDSLTGLPNRVAFQRALTAACDQARRERSEHALCFVDLDRFKAINDTAGHAAGDALLQRVAQAIKGACRTEDVTARMGGDEFAILLANCSTAGAKKAAQLIIDAIADLGFDWGGVTYDIGASIGVTAITASSPQLAKLMHEADVACYAAKAAGRNCVSVYDPIQTGSFAQKAG